MHTQNKPLFTTFLIQYTYQIITSHFQHNFEQKKYISHLPFKYRCTLNDSAKPSCCQSTGCNATDILQLKLKTANILTKSLLHTVNAPLRTNPSISRLPYTVILSTISQRSLAQLKIDWSQCHIHPFVYS